MKEFAIETIDGHRIMFGETLKFEINDPAKKSLGCVSVIELLNIVLEHEDDRENTGEPVSR